MNIPHRIKIISGFSLAMLTLFSMALFVLPDANKTQAQSGLKTQAYCLQRVLGTVTFVSGMDKCPQNDPNVIPSARPLSDTGLCLFKRQSTGFYEVAERPRIVNGQCLLDPPSTTPYGEFIKFPNAVTPPTPVPPGNPPGGSNTNTGGTGSGTKTPQVPCTDENGKVEDGFHRVGPLCVPDNPFNDNSIAGGNQTASSLAVRIIRIMLYLAAIVAVIMIIIGGYYVMTARGNETQAASGRKTLTNAIIGLVIIILAYVIVQAVLNFITK